MPKKGIVSITYTLSFLRKMMKNRRKITRKITINLLPLFATFIKCLKNF